jgi:hypothetical protein
MLKPIVERKRIASPSPQPHAIATDGSVFWVSSRVTRRIDVIERERWRKVAELAPPGMPWGMSYEAGVLVMTCGESDEDTRRIRRFSNGHGFVEGFVACPDDTGSHLALLDGVVLLGQWYNKKLLRLRGDGSTERAYPTPHEVCGVAVRDGVAYLLGTDEEEHGDYYVSSLDLESGTSLDLALVPFPGRGLAWDGRCFWSNHRAANHTVAFDLPG